LPSDRFRVLPHEGVAAKPNAPIGRSTQSVTIHEIYKKYL
jgi:hypothetical protein